jgi:quinol monooxygenase YgiN
MTIYRIGSFQANADLLQEMQDFLYSIIPMIKSSQGCEAVQLFQSQDDPTKFTMIEVWDSVESHRASVKNIPSEKLMQIQPLLATPPSGSYYRLLHEMGA